MIRRCDGTDPNLIREIPGTGPDVPMSERYEPCACGRFFNDVERSVIFPHVKFLPEAQREILMNELAGKDFTDEELLKLWTRLTGDDV